MDLWLWNLVIVLHVTVANLWLFVSLIIIMIMLHIFGEITLSYIHTICAWHWSWHTTSSLKKKIFLILGGLNMCTRPILYISTHAFWPVELLHRWWRNSNPLPLRSHSWPYKGLNIRSNKSWCSNQLSFWDWYDEQSRTKIIPRYSIV